MGFGVILIHPVGIIRISRRAWHRALDAWLAGARKGGAMKPRAAIPLILAFALSLALGGAALAKDLDDKIGQEDGFEFDNDLKRNTNVKYTKVKAKSDAKRDKGGSIEAGSGDTNINSAVVGGNVYGDIIIIDEGKGNKNIIK
jgi:hypothetical protein